MSRVGVRSKIVLLLTLVALLPLLGALLVIVIGSASLRLSRVQQSCLAVATAEARALKSSLVSDLQQFEVVLRRPEIVVELAKRTEALPTGELQRLDASWATLPEDLPPLSDILRGPGSASLQLLRQTNQHFAEVFISDRYGQLVTATNRTTDFYQADEEWWQGAFYAGKGRVVISQVSRDTSSGVWSVDLCVPVFDEAKIVGIGKAVVNINRWLGGLSRSVGMLKASVMLVSEEGRILYRERIEPLERLAEEWAGDIATGERSGARITRGGEIQAFVPIALTEADIERPVGMPWWTLVLYMPEAQALGSVYVLSFVGLAVGLVGIGLLFLAGVYLIDRQVVRRVLRIAEVARRVAGGDLTSRVETTRRDGTPSRQDEIDELRRDFNYMIEQVERSYLELKAANDLKQKFLRVAGHELRTPVSYILGMARLLAGSDDPIRLREAMVSMGSKADRLNGIIEAMFKLMQGGGLPLELRHDDVVVADLVEAIRAEVQPFLDQRHQTLAVEISNAAVRLRADRQRIFDVLQNLLTNAIKFTPDGGKVTISVRLEPDDRMAFAVTDQGAGITKEEFAHLFQPFYSGGEVLQHSSGQAGFQKRGMGLGLAVVRYFVELHNGTVEATTGPGGSTFTVRLPIGPREEQIPGAS